VLRNKQIDLNGRKSTFTNLCVVGDAPVKWDAWTKLGRWHWNRTSDQIQDEPYTELGKVLSKEWWKQ